MPEKRIMKKAAKARRAGKSSSSQAGEFVREEIHKIRRGEHGARSSKQVIAIGLSKARRAGVKLKPPRKGKASEETRRNAARDYAAGQNSSRNRKPSRKRSRATTAALKREGQSAAERSRAARKGVRTRKHIRH